MCAATPHRAAVETTIAEMRGRLDEPLSLDALAGAVHLSRFHFARVFRELTGVPPGRFLTALRLERAKQLLLTSSQPVTEISLDVGYRSLGAFTSHFTALVGVAPARFRALAGDESAALLAEVLERARADALPAGGLRGELRATGGPRRLVFVGLFDAALPQRRPRACALVRGDGGFALDPVRDGRYALAAVSFPPDSELRDYLLPEWTALRVGGTEIELGAGHAEGDADLVLAPPAPTDPPIITAMPLLLLERELATSSKAREAGMHSLR